MHRVVRAHLESFVERHGLSMAVDKAFEAFVTYCLLRRYSSDAVVPGDLIYEGEDPGNGSIVIIVDDLIIASTDELKEILKRPRRNFDGMIIITQAKTG